MNGYNNHYSYTGRGDRYLGLVHEELIKRFLKEFSLSTLCYVVYQRNKCVILFDSTYSNISDLFVSSIRKKLRFVMSSSYIKSDVIHYHLDFSRSSDNYKSVDVPFNNDKITLSNIDDKIFSFMISRKFPNYEIELSDLSEYVKSYKDILRIKRRNLKYYFKNYDTEIINKKNKYHFMRLFLACNLIRDANLRRFFTVRTEKLSKSKICYLCSNKDAKHKIDVKDLFSFNSKYYNHSVILCELCLNRTNTTYQDYVTHSDSVSEIEFLIMIYKLRSVNIKYEYSISDDDFKTTNIDVDLIDKPINCDLCYDSSDVGGKYKYNNDFLHLCKYCTLSIEDRKDNSIKLNRMFDYIVRYEKPSISQEDIETVHYYHDDNKENKKKFDEIQKRWASVKVNEGFEVLL